MDRIESERRVLKEPKMELVRDDEEESLFEALEQKTISCDYDRE